MLLSIPTIYFNDINVTEQLRKMKMVSCVSDDCISMLNIEAYCYFLSNYKINYNLLQHLHK